METRILTVDQLAEVYRTAFDHVCNPADWRSGLVCLVPWDVANIYMQAIEFMTGEKPTCERIVEGGKTSAKLSSVGYRNGRCGG